MTMPFPASYDTTTKVLSGLVCLVLIGGAVAAKIPILAGLVVALIILSYAYSPRGYAIAERAIVVNRLIGDVRIPLDGVREVRAATKDDLGCCIRLWGSGGMFGYYGLFRTSKLGKSTWYVTNRSNMVVVRTDAKTALFSPDEVERFVTSIRATVPVPELAAGGPSCSSRRSILALIGPLAGLAGLAFAIFAVMYSPGPPSCTLTPESLAIRDFFYPVTLQATAVDVGRIRVVDLGTDTAWRVTARTNGFANAHYRSGWFRVASGAKVRLYRAAGTRLVLLPPKGDGAPVLLEVPQPERFVETLQREWSRQ